MSHARLRRRLAVLRNQVMGEGGQVMLLGIGIVAVVLALVLAVASATAIYLDLKNLTGMADLAAASAAANVDQSQYFRTGANADRPLDDEGVNRAVQAYLAQTALEGGLSNVELLSATSPDGVSVRVQLRGYSKPPFLPWGVISAEGFILRAQASARVATRRD
ncbi:glycosyltransferase [Actinomyces trachealis]|uniref:glycosyltransferase n=1 Tax=Actinomyces trachealis TaxID=2763540 RepID=UPI001F2FD9A1|nr:glycosyltransferase [Actinomyces trachealis]